jgi:hypothetical protein
MTWDPHGGREEWARLAEPTRPPDILVPSFDHYQGQFGFPQEIHRKSTGLSTTRVIHRLLHNCE